MLKIRQLRQQLADAQHRQEPLALVAAKALQAPLRPVHEHQGDQHVQVDNLHRKRLSRSKAGEDLLSQYRVTHVPAVFHLSAVVTDAACRPATRCPGLYGLSPDGSPAQIRIPFPSPLMTMTLDRFSPRCHREPGGIDSGDEAES